MGISRDSRHKRRLTGGRRNVHQKKRKYELGRQPASTKIGTKRVVEIRVRGGNTKYRSLRLDSGNFSWGTESCTRRARILDVVYNASNNELVRTKTLVKNAIVQIDATGFRQYYEQFYGVALGKKKKEIKESKDTKDGDSNDKDKDTKDTKDSKDSKDKDKSKDKLKDKSKDKSKSRSKDKSKDKLKDKDKDKDKEKDDENKPKSKRVEKKLKQRNVSRVLDPHLKDQFNSGRLFACIASRPGQSGRCDGYVLEAKELEFYLKKLQKKK